MDRICQETIACQVDSEDEVVCNEAVHSRLLEAELVPFDGKVKSRNITTADIHPTYLLSLTPQAADTTSTTASGSAGDLVIPHEDSMSATTGGDGVQLAVQAKRVDYALVLSDTETEDASRKLLRDVNFT